MKKASLVLLFLMFLSVGANAQKLAKQMGAEACKCYNDKAYDMLRERSPKDLATACIKKAVEKYAKKLAPYTKGDKNKYNALMTETSIYIINCGGFDYLKDEEENSPSSEAVNIKDVPAPANSNDCSGMREGVFQYISDDVDLYFVERRDSVQFEYWGSSMIETRVIWDSECKYHTAHVSTNSDAVRKKLTPGQGVVVAITEVNGNDYTVLVQGPDGTQTTSKYKKVENREFKYIGK